MLPASASVPCGIRTAVVGIGTCKRHIQIRTETGINHSVQYRLVAASTEDAILLLMRISTRPSSCTISMGESAEQAANTDSKTPSIYKIHLFRFISILYIG